MKGKKFPAFGGVFLYPEVTVLEAFHLKEPVFTGSCTAIITPFSDDGIDYERMKKLLDFQRENGTKAIVLAGTTGENATLDIREYEELVDLCIQHAAGGMKMIVGVGGNDTARCLSKARFAAAAGADAVLMTPPYYNKTSQRGLVRHFMAVADASEVPLILYNVPGRTVLSITAESYLRLSAHPNINGVKEASGDISLAARLAAECGDALNLWSGNDDQTIPMMALGAKGVISVVSNVLPGVVAELCDLCLAGDFKKGLELYTKYAEFYRLLFVEVNPIPVKAAMALAGLDNGYLRPPLVEISPENLEKLRKSMETLGCIA